MFKPKALFIAAALIAAASVHAKDADTLRLGIDPGYPPMDVKTPDGHVAGFDVDLGDEICRRIAMRCQWVELEFSGMIPALQARKIDGIMSSMAITDKRMKQIAFSSKLFQFRSRLLAKQGAPLTATAQGLRGKRIGVQSGSQFETYAMKNWQPGGVEIVAYQSMDGVLNDLSAGRIDAALLGSVEAEHGFLKTPRGAGFAFVGEPLSMGDHGVGMGLRQDDTALKAKVDKAVTDMRADGTYQKIARKYFDFDVYGD
ncbi:MULTISPECIES: transporter substrate-binding domain-containing protein [unclassified Caballeronia]|uniref:transporter substrate-binding domain-containing protein n=1 Tax=unclassified Caballeronia TaxID=2646786 RepID=UPI001F1A85DC|nr:MULTISPECIES: transporter substrate-binding domain-containing protein [unclassified Caballeronia]MCE4544122.1 transporter substrate-binding domain-containing protein [Caballeronia sp. PC1]MCE4571273.1 transporter substrate-binding domain-containing protein [Caballeronia sp. CLC5]